MFIHPLHYAAAGVYANAAKISESATRIAYITNSGYNKSYAADIHAAASVHETTLPPRDIEAIPDFDEECIRVSAQDGILFLLDIAGEFAQMRVAVRGYQANIAALRTEDNMIGSILDIIT